MCPSRENDCDKEVYNGDIGYIDDVDPSDGKLTASFDGRTIIYGFGELDVLLTGLGGDHPQRPSLGIRKTRIKKSADSDTKGSA